MVVAPILCDEPEKGVSVDSGQEGQTIPRIDMLLVEKKSGLLPSGDFRFDARIAAQAGAAVPQGARLLKSGDCAAKLS
jgi:hypothetical protein